MTYREFKRVCDLDKLMGVTPIGTISAVKDDMCVLQVEDRESLLLIKDVINDVCFNGMGTVANPEALQGWQGFIKEYVEV